MSAALDLIRDMVKAELFSEELAADLEEAIGKGREPESRLAKIAHRTQKATRKHLKKAGKEYTPPRTKGKSSVAQAAKKAIAGMRAHKAAVSARAKAEGEAKKKPEAKKKVAAKKKPEAKKKVAAKKKAAPTKKAAKPEIPAKAKEKPPEKKARAQKKPPEKTSLADAKKAVAAYKRKLQRDAKAGKRRTGKGRPGLGVPRPKDKRTEKDFVSFEPVRHYQNAGPKDIIHSHPNVKKGGGSLRGSRGTHGTWVRQQDGGYKHVSGDVKHSPFRHQGHLGTTPVPDLKHGSGVPHTSRHVMQTKCWKCTREGKLRQKCERQGPASKCGGAPVIHIKINPTYREKYNKAYKFYEKYKRHLKGGKPTRSFHKARKH